MNEVAKYFQQIDLCYEAQDEITKHNNLESLFKSLIFDEKLETYTKWNILKCITDVKFCVQVQKAAAAAADLFVDAEMRHNAYYAVLEAAIKYLRTHQELFCVEAF